LRAAAALQVSFGGDAMLAPATLLIEHLQAEQAPAAVRLEADAVLTVRSRLDGPLAAAALAALGDASPCWLEARWRALAQAAASIFRCIALGVMHFSLKGPTATL